MLLLYLDYLFLTGTDGLISNTKRKLDVDFEMKDFGYDALISRYGGVAEYEWNIPWTREVCNRDPKEVWDDGLQDYGHTNGIEHESIK